MIYRSVHTIFEPSGQPIPSEDEVQFEAREIVERTGWGLPLIEALHRMRDPYWREAVTRCLMEKWQNLVRDKDEQTYYYDLDGCARYAWADADCDFSRLIRRSTNEQVEYEQRLPQTPVAVTVETKPHARQQVNIYIQQNYGPIISDSYVTIH